jgi:hypothetical protein
LEDFTGVPWRRRQQSGPPDFSLNRRCTKIPVICPLQRVPMWARESFMRLPSLSSIGPIRADVPLHFPILPAPLLVDLSVWPIYRMDLTILRTRDSGRLLSSWQSRLPIFRGNSRLSGCRSFANSIYRKYCLSGGCRSNRAIPRAWISHHLRAVRQQRWRHAERSEASLYFLFFPDRGGNTGILRRSAPQDNRCFRLASPYVSKRCEKCRLVSGYRVSPRAEALDGYGVRVQTCGNKRDRRF